MSLKFSVKLYEHHVKLILKLTLTDVFVHCDWTGAGFISLSSAFIKLALIFLEADSRLGKSSAGEFDFEGRDCKKMTKLLIY